MSGLGRCSVLGTAVGVVVLIGLRLARGFCLRWRVTSIGTGGGPAPIILFCLVDCGISERHMMIQTF